MATTKKAYNGNAILEILETPKQSTDIQFRAHMPKFVIRHGWR